LRCRWRRALRRPHARARRRRFLRAAVAQRHELAERFLFITGDTANAEVWRFLQDTRVPVLEKPFTPQALLRAVEQVSA
jgi:hypothetical protein